MAKLRFGACSGLAFFSGLYIDAISFHLQRRKTREISASQSAKVRHHQEYPAAARSSATKMKYSVAILKSITTLLQNKSRRWTALFQVRN
jgi:hypothetical protein